VRVVPGDELDDLPAGVEIEDVQRVEGHRRAGLELAGELDLHGGGRPVHERARRPVEVDRVGRERHGEVGRDRLAADAGLDPRCDELAVGREERGDVRVALAVDAVEIGPQDSAHVKDRLRAHGVKVPANRLVGKMDAWRPWRSSAAATVPRS
jgi:hypothetical protein